MPPEHLLRNGRPEDQAFDADELLYRRYIREHLHNDKIVDAHFDFPRTSVNRGKYSQPEDVLFSENGQFERWGVLEFPVSGIPAILQDAQGERFVCFPAHAPLDSNYGHTEIACERERQRGEPAIPGPAARKKFRAMLSKQVRVRIPATD
jgi:hypothetical protein